MNTQEFSGYHYTIYEADCNDYHNEFGNWIEENYPGIEIEFVPTNNIGYDNFFDAEGTPLYDNLWEEFCNNS